MVTVLVSLMVISGFFPTVGIWKLLSVSVMSILTTAVMNAKPAGKSSVVRASIIWALRKLVSR